MLVRLAEAWDVIGNPASEPVRPVTFAASAQADTAQPRLTRLSPADSTRSLNRDTRLLFTFGAAVDTAGLGAWRLLGPDTLATRMTWRDLSTMELRPLGDPTQDVWYRLEAPLPALRSWTGTSTEIWEKAPAWRGTRPPGQGFLTIQVEGDALLSGGAYRVILEGVTSGATPRTLLQADMPGRLTTPLLAEGGYLIWGYADTDGDGIVGTGSVRPWRPAERGAAIADTQYVRERFESVVATPLDLRGMRRVERSAAVPDTGIVQQPPPTDGSPPGRRP